MNKSDRNKAVKVQKVVRSHFLASTMALLSIFAVGTHLSGQQMLTFDVVGFGAVNVYWTHRWDRRPMMWLTVLTPQTSLVPAQNQLLTEQHDEETDANYELHHRVRYLVRIQQRLLQNRLHLGTHMEQVCAEKYSTAETHKVTQQQFAGRAFVGDVAGNLVRQERAYQWQQKRAEQRQQLDNPPWHGVCPRTNAIFVTFFITKSTRVTPTSKPEVVQSLFTCDHSGFFSEPRFLLIRAKKT